MMRRRRKRRDLAEIVIGQIHAARLSSERPPQFAVFSLNGG